MPDHGLSVVAMTPVREKPRTADLFVQVPFDEELPLDLVERLVEFNLSAGSTATKRPAALRARSAFAWRRGHACLDRSRA